MIIQIVCPKCNRVHQAEIPVIKQGSHIDIGCQHCKWNLVRLLQTDKGLTLAE